MEAEWVDAGPVEIVEEERGDKNESLGIGGMEAKGKEKQGEPNSGTLHEEPGEGWGHCGTPTWPLVLAIWCLEEPEGDEGGRSNQEEGEEAVVKEGMI